MSSRDWPPDVAETTGRTDVLEIPVPRRGASEDAELEAVIRLNLRHERAAQRFGLFVSALAIVSIPLAINLFVLYVHGMHGGVTTFLLALWTVAFSAAAIAGLRSARLMAKLDDAAHRVGAKRSKSAD